MRHLTRSLKQFENVAVRCGQVSRNNSSGFSFHVCFHASVPHRRAYVCTRVCVCVHGNFESAVVCHQKHEQKALRAGGCMQSDRAFAVHAWFQGYARPRYGV